jgi:hypothetical protein
MNERLRPSARDALAQQTQRRERDSRRKPPTSPAPAASIAGPLIEITPTPEEYELLCSDLAKLRKLGAPSNTAAVLAAVSAAAGGKFLSAKLNMPAAVGGTPDAGQR